MLHKNINAQVLIKFLKTYNYEVARQTGSHIRLVSDYMGYEHKITIPNHKPLKIGTLNNIINDIAKYLKKDKSKIIKELNK